MSVYTGRRSIEFAGTEPGALARRATGEMGIVGALMSGRFGVGSFIGPAWHRLQEGI